MSIDRRALIGLFAASAATALAGCGGGGDYQSPPTRFVWVLNVNPDFVSVDVSFNSTRVATAMPFESLTLPIEVEFGTYTIGLRDRGPSGRNLLFDGFNVDNYSPSIEVFYRKGTSARLGASPSGIVNYFDSPELLVAELDDGTGFVQTTVLPFEGSAPQASQSLNCRLRLRRASDGVLVYDSGLRRRSGAIVIYPADPVLGFVGVVGLDYSFSDATAVRWPNIL